MFILCNLINISLYVEWGKLIIGLLRNIINNFIYYWMFWFEGIDICIFCSYSEVG